MYRRFQSSCALLLVLLLAACGQNQQAAQPTLPAQAEQVTTVAPAETSAAATTGASEPTTSAETATTEATSTVEASAPATVTPGPGEFANPVIDRDFPDPDVVKVGDTYYAYATNFGSTNIQVAKSTDLVKWEQLNDALPVLPLWSYPGYTWAPEVTSWDDGQTFVMYFTIRHAESNKQCIGAATSEEPEGPFQPVGDQAFICQLDEGGSIDASSFVDEDGTQYVLWKNDGNCCGMTTWLYLQKVSADGLTLEDEPVQLVQNDQAWEGNLVEAPTLWKHNGKYYLFYSANSYAGADYATGYAVADAITGPYQKPDEPLLSTDFKQGAAVGPGGQDIVFDDDGETWMLYHSWDPTVSYRRMQIDELVWEGDTPVVKGPDKGPQPVP